MPRLSSLSSSSSSSASFSSSSSSGSRSGSSRSRANTTKSKSSSKSSSNFAGAKKTGGGGGGGAVHVKQKKTRTKAKGGAGTFGGAYLELVKDDMQIVTITDNQTHNPHLIALPNEAMAWSDQDLPISLLPAKHKAIIDYGAALVLVYKVAFNLFGVMQTQTQNNAMSIVNDVDEKNDSIDVLEKQLLTVIAMMSAGLSKTSTTLKTVFSLYNPSMGHDLRDYFYKDNLSWRYFVDNVAPNEGVLVKQIKESRHTYKQLLVKIYMRLVSALNEGVSSTVLDVELRRIQATPVALCEARVFYLAMRLQSQKKMFIRIPSEWVDDAKTIYPKSFIHPHVSNMMTAYADLKSAKY